MSKDENIGTRSAGTEEKEVIVSKLSDLVVGVWEKAGDKFRTKSDAEAKDSVVAAALTDLDTRLNSVSGEVEDKADLNHSHGFLTNEGTINSAATIASGDHLVITDASELGKVKRTSIAFDGVSEDKALTKAGTWETMLGSAAITNAINALDVSSVGGSGKYISSISETDGKISATATSFDSIPTANSSNAVTSSGIKTALDAKENSSNKVTSWQSTPDNTHYPSEKLVKDELDEKIPKTTNASEIISSAYPQCFYSTSYYGEGYVLFYDVTSAFDGTFTNLSGDQDHVAFSGFVQSAKYNGYGVPQFYKVEGKVNGKYPSNYNASTSKIYGPVVLKRTYQEGGVTKNRYYFAIKVPANYNHGMMFFGVFHTRGRVGTSLSWDSGFLGNLVLSTDTEYTVHWSWNAGYNVATSLFTARKLAVNLANTATDTSFDGSADQTGIKVSGTLSVANGGTGQTSLANVTVGSATKATQDSDGNAINTTYFKSSGNTTLVSGSATKIGTQNGADVKLTLPSIPAAVSVKGNAESSYRTGQVNLTPANLGISATTSSVTVGSTTFNKYTHPTTAGNKHVPSGGSSGQILGWDSDGTAKWIDSSSTDTKVKATAKSDNANYKILATASTSPTSGNATEAVYDTDITLNPSTNTIAANLSGNAATATSATSSTYAETLLPNYITESSSGTWVEVGTFQSNTANDMYAGITFAVEFRDNSGRTQSGLAWLSAGEYKGSGATYSNADIICEYFTLCSRDQQFSTNVAFYANRNGTSDTSPITIYAKLNSYSSLILTPINAKKGHYTPSMTYLDSEPATKKEFTYRNLLRTTHGTAVGSATTPVFVNSYGQVQECTPSSMSVGSATNATNADLATSASHIVTQGAAVNSTARHIWFSDANTETMRAHNDNFKYTPSTNTISANITGSADSASTATALSKTQLGSQVTELPITSMISSPFKAGTFMISNSGNPYTFGNVTIPKNQWFRFLVNGESPNYCTITLDPCAGGSNTDMSSFEILVDSGVVKKVVRVPYATTTSAIGSSVIPAYIDAKGEFKACDLANMSVGFAAAAYPGSDLANVTAPDADTLVLQYQTSTSTATQFSNAVNAYNSHKKLYAKWAGTYTSETNTYTYEQLIPLSYVSYTNTGGTPQIVMFSFKDVYDSVTGGEANAGQIHTLHLDATHWTEASVMPYGATNAAYAANAGNADKWGGKALSIGSVGGTGYISYL